MVSGSIAPRSARRRSGPGGGALTAWPPLLLSLPDELAFYPTRSRRFAAAARGAGRLIDRACLLPRLADWIPADTQEWPDGSSLATKRDLTRDFAAHVVRSIAMRNANIEQAKVASVVS